MGNTGLPKAIERANSHIRYWRYRRRLGTPILLRVALSQWWRRLAHEWLGIGNGA